MSAERLDLARKMGATKTVVVTSKDPAEVAQLSVYFTVLFCNVQSRYYCLTPSQPVRLTQGDQQSQTSVPKSAVWCSIVMQWIAPFLLSHSSAVLKDLAEKTELRNTALITLKNQPEAASTIVLYCSLLIRIHVYYQTCLLNVWSWPGRWGPRRRWW